LNTSSLDIECEINVDDAIAWNYYYLKTTSGWKFMTVARFIFIPIFGLISLFALVMVWIAVDTSDSLTPGIEGLVLGLGGFLYFLLYPQIKRSSLRSHLNKAYSQGVNAVIGKQRYSFSLDGIQVTNAHGYETIKWDVVDSITQTKNHIFVRVRPNSALVIPKRTFAVASTSEQFTNNLSQILESKKTTI
jgi:YcxB-like protein